MTRTILTALILSTVPCLSACGDSNPAPGGNVTMRDMEVVDGTANDSMADLDNVTADGTLLSNMGELPVQGTESRPANTGSDANSTAADTKTERSGEGANIAE